MATIQDRTYSRTYAGLKNQFAVAGVLAACCLIAYELMRRRRRGRGRHPEYKQQLGSVETWEFGYLYQGRCWAKLPSPALPKFPLQWVIQAITYPESNLPRLIGVDASTYIRFLKGCRLFVFIHALTTFPIIFTVHIVFSPSNLSLDSMDKASISSLVPSEQRLLFIHVILAYWIAITWILNLLWTAHDTFRFRAQANRVLLEKYSTQSPESESPFNPNEDLKNRGLRLRTVMVTNIPVLLRNERDLKEYFEYHLSRPLAKPPIAFGLFTRVASLLYHRIVASSPIKRFKAIPDDAAPHQHDNALTKDEHDAELHSLPVVERVVIARKMTELASLLERRDTVLKELEHAHIRLARNVLQSVRDRTDSSDQKQEWTKEEREIWLNLSTFVERFQVPSSQPAQSVMARVERVRRFFGQKIKNDLNEPGKAAQTATDHRTIWEALHDLPRSHLDPYQPLIRLNKLFFGKSVPEIDYYVTRLSYLTSLIHDDKSLPVDEYQPTSTAFVTFSKIEDAKRATKFLQTHPRNPLACLVVPAPDVRDLDWARIMKSSFTGEFVKDWVIDAGVWAFTVSWIIPITFLIALVNIQNLSVVLPGLGKYFDKHPHDKEAITSLLPTIIFSLLAILIPILLLLIGKKGHTIVTFSKLHDTIMVRYWKFLVCNLLIFFCVGVGALESFLQFFKHSVDFITVISKSFPIAGPFYVGWLILQTAIHGFLELGLFGLPLIVYPSTKIAKTLRRRAEGIHPRTFNFYYWLPNHLLVVTIVLLFSLLNPLVIPFALVYFCVESVIVKHQLLHVYSRAPYENNGKVILIRIVRFSLDGLILAHVVFLAFLIVLKETPEAAFIGILLVLTVFVKLGLTRYCRLRFGEGDKAEEAIFNNKSSEPLALQKGVDEAPFDTRPAGDNSEDALNKQPKGKTLASGQFMTWKEFPRGVQFNYASYPPRRQFNTHRPINPFQPQPSGNNVQSSSRNAAEGEEVEQPLTEEPGQLSPTLLSDHGQRGQSRSSTLIVTPHPPFPNWDDSPDLDHPYDNPFYRASVESVLWLPRNPFGELDLDDTVDLHVALTSEGRSEKLDRWLDEENGEEGGEVGDGNHGRLTESPQMSYSPLSLGEDGLRRPPIRTDDSGRTKSTVSKFRPQRQYTGMENISMSSVLAARASALEKENEIRRRMVVKGNNQKQRINNIIDDRDLRYVLSTETTSSRHPRLHSRVYDPVHEPDLHAESTPLRESIGLISPSGVEGAKEAGQHQGTISLGEAVLSEVVAEEQHHALQRLQQEVNEKRTWERFYKPARWRWFFWHSSGLDDDRLDTQADHGRSEV